MDSELRNTLRHYFQSGDITLFPSIVAYANRGGPATINGVIGQLCEADLNGLGQIFIKKFGGVIERGLSRHTGHHVRPMTPGPIPSPEEPVICGFRFRKLWGWSDNTVWSISIGITYSTFLGYEPDMPDILIDHRSSIMRRAPLIMIYPTNNPPHQYQRPEIVGPVYRTIKDLFPHYTVEIAGPYPQRHEVINGCPICGSPKAEHGLYCRRHLLSLSDGL